MVLVNERNRITNVSILVAFIISAYSFCFAAASEVNVPLNRLRLALLENRISSIRVLHAPDELITKLPVDQDLLQRKAVCDKRVEIGDERRNELVVILEQTTVKPFQGTPDLRWGIVFLESDGETSHSIYLDGRHWDGTGRRGIVNGTAARTNGGLGFWLEQSFPECMKARPNQE